MTANEFSEEDVSEQTKQLLPRDSQTTPRNSNRVMFLAVAAMLLGAIASGTLLGMSSPLIPSIKDDESKNAIHIDDSEASWIGSLLSVGGIVGALLAGTVMQAVGRKLTSILSGIPYVAGLLLISYATNVWMIYVGRFITGIGLAFTSLVVPTYIGEVSTHTHRGLLGSGNQLAITMGILLVYGIGGLFNWRWFVIGIAVIPVLYVILCLFIPETPRHLYMKNQRRESIAVLQRLRGRQADISEELRQLHECTTCNYQEASWMDLILDPTIRKPLLLSLVAMFFQQLSGINAVMFYAQSIFADAGFNTKSQQHVAVVLTGVVQVLFTFISCVVVDRSGRRLLWAVSSIFMFASMTAFGFYFQFASGGNLNWLALVSLLVYIASFALGLGPLPWLLMVELLPLRAKGKCGGLATLVNLLLCFVVTKEFHDLSHAITTQGVYWVFGGFCLLSFLFGLFVLPETRGRSLEDIEAYFCNRHDKLEYERIPETIPEHT